MEELIRSYKELHGQYVETSGIYYANFEQSALFQHRMESNSKRAFWVDFSSDFNLSDSAWQALSNKRGTKVTLKGKIDTTSRGHLSQYSATLRNTYYFDEN
ncbi:MAG: hypothetical protein EOP48_08645 [Sphingobacteriales bacterium]|nr:MAG: hypothetical protein EOP48_08645 [Sphingobacteriales bacterium]